MEKKQNFEETRKRFEKIDLKTIDRTEIKEKAKKETLNSLQSNNSKPNPFYTGEWINKLENDIDNLNQGITNKKTKPLNNKTKTKKELNRSSLYTGKYSYLIEH